MEGIKDELKKDELKSCKEYGAENREKLKAEKKRKLDESKYEEKF